MNSKYDSHSREKSSATSWQKISLFISPLLVLSAGCATDLSSVEEFGASSTQLTAASNAFAADIYASCIRRLDFITRVPGTDGGGANEVLRRQTREQCIAENQEVAEQTKIANQVPVNYMVALGELAAKNPVDFSANINAIEQALNSISIPRGVNPVTQEALPPFTFNPTVVEAGGNILEFLVNQLTGQFRQQQIKEAILCNNEPFHLYLTGEKPVSDGNSKTFSTGENGLI